jgi:hypothetical protein
LPPSQLISTLLDLIEHGTGGAAYYTDLMESIVGLAVGAPPRPPASSAEFLARLDATWLTAAYTSVGDLAAAGLAQSGRKGVDDVALRFRALWRRLGPGLDGGGSFADADAWYCTLQGTAEPAVAEAQARALTDLLAAYAMSGQREIVLSVDEFSSVARRLPIWRLYERARSLGLAVQVTAQSWEGLGGDDDERYRVASTAEGGIWLLRTPRPEPVAELAGTRTVVQTTRYLSGRHTWESSGISTQREVPVVDPDIIRRLDVGQAAYLYRGGVTYLHVKPPASATADEPLIRVRAIPALPWAPPRPALPDQAPPRRPAPALPPGQEHHRRPELADTQPLPVIQPAIEAPPHPPDPPRPPATSTASRPPGATPVLKAFGRRA